MIKNYLFLLAIFCMVNVNSQELIRPIDLVSNAAHKNQPVKVSLFKTVEKKSSKLSSVLEDFVEVDLDFHGKKQREITSSNFIEVDVPISKKDIITLQLVKVDLYGDNPEHKVYPSGKSIKISSDNHYRGIIKGMPQSVVSLSIFENEIMGIASGLNNSNLVIGKIVGKESHVIYFDNQIARQLDFECETLDDNISYKAADLVDNSNANNSLEQQCVRLLIEVNNNLYEQLGGISNTVNYVSGLMNQVMTLYANEGIRTKVRFKFWTSQSPYTAKTSSELLQQFRNYRKNWKGDFAQLIGRSGNGGVASRSKPCDDNKRSLMSYSLVGRTYEVLPTYSYSVFVIAHEFGHSMGLHHTHACVWNGNGTAIDGCAQRVEFGNCPLPDNPSDGGTIMSYCHIRAGVGVNFDKGFGVQPGNVLRNNISEADCFSRNCLYNSSCQKNLVSISLKTDNYPEELSWVLLDSNNQVILEGGHYENANTRYKEEACIEDGCYTLKVFDSGGNGICCTDGYGYFNISLNEERVAVIRDLESSKVVDFCANVPCVESSLVLKTDKYPREISWDLKDSNNQIVDQGDNLTIMDNVYEINKCLEPGCYELSFYDTNGDGFCCTYGEGYYKFFEDGNLVLNEWADFNRKITKTVCVGNGKRGLSKNDQKLILEDKLPPFTINFNIESPFKEILKIKFDSTKELVKIKNLVVTNISGGKVYSQQNVSTNVMLEVDATSWPSGVYIVTMHNNGQKESVKVIKK